MPSTNDAGGDGDRDYLLAVVGNLLRKLDGVDHSTHLCDEGGAGGKENAKEQEYVGYALLHDLRSKNGFIAVC